MKFFEICVEVLVPKFTRAEIRLPEIKGYSEVGDNGFFEILVGPIHHLLCRIFSVGHNDF